MTSDKLYLHMCASVTKQYNLVGGNLFGWESNRGPGRMAAYHRVYDYVICGLTAPRNRDQLCAQTESVPNARNCLLRVWDNKVTMASFTITFYVSVADFML